MAFLAYNDPIMKMIELLEKDKDHLLTELAKAAVPEKATVVLKNEMDKLLLRYNDQCDNDKRCKHGIQMLNDHPDCI